MAIRRRTETDVPPDDPLGPPRDQPRADAGIVPAVVDPTQIAGKNPVPSGSSSKPTEVFGTTQPPTPPTTTRVETAQATPTRPTDPTPIASEAPQPFTPMTPPPMAQGGGGMSGIVRRSVVPGGPNTQGSMLLGHAGGLLNGGLGVPGILGGGGDDISALIANLFKQANRGGY